MIQTWGLVEYFKSEDAEKTKLLLKGFYINGQSIQIRKVFQTKLEWLNMNPFKDLLLLDEDDFLVTFGENNTQIYIS